MEFKQNDIGIRFGHYTTIAILAKGGFSTVYVGRHQFFQNRIVAIKVLHAEKLSSQKEQERFLREAYLLEKLKHPYIVPVVDVGVQGGVPYLVTEYFPNGSLQERLNRQFTCPLPIEECFALLKQIGNALNYTHKMNIVHCDLKPLNILLNARGEAFLADFGIATILRRTGIFHSETVLGSIAYMAPEQLQGTICKESDQYSFACIAYILFTGRLPFEASNAEALIRMHLYELPLLPTSLNPYLPTSIDVAIMKGLAKQRTDRYSDISELLEALQADVSTVKIPSRLLPHQRVEFWLHKGNTFYKLGRFEAALSAYNYALQLDPRCVPAYNNKGSTLYSLGRYGASFSAYNQALKLDPYYAAAYRGKGSVLERLGRLEEAQRAYKKAKQLG